MDPPSLSGALACSLKSVVTEIAETAALRRGLASVPPDVRLAFESMMPIGWVPVDVMETVFAAIARELGMTVGELHVQTARISIERTMRTLWRMLLRVTTDHALVSRTPVMFSRSYNRGRLQAHILAPGRAEVRLLDWPNPPEWPLRATCIGIETVLRIAGRTNVRAEYQRTPEGADYIATWD